MINDKVKKYNKLKKGEKMKEKIIIMSALTFVFATFYLGKDKISHQKEFNKIEKITIKEPEERSNTNNVKKPTILKNSNSNLTNKKQSTIKVCSSTKEQTDKLSFSNAFRYYLKCQGLNSKFTWKGESYLARLKNNDMNRKHTAKPNHDEKLKDNIAIKSN